MFALIFLVENSFYYESATELSSDFKTGQHKMENSSSDPAIFIVDSSMSR